MAFIKLSQELKKDGFTLVNNSFISFFMPNAPENAVKVYLQGLYFSSINAETNTLDKFCESLNLTKEEVENAFVYWENQGLVKIDNINDFAIVFLPIDNKTIKFKPIDEQKYGDFYILCQSQLERNLSPNEFKEYVHLIEHEKIEPEALLMIIKYCVASKEKDIPANYILTVAKNWIGEKIFTTKAVEQKIKELELTSENLLNILRILGVRRSATLEERDMYIKWTKVFFFTDKTILDVAEMQKKKGGMKGLDSKLTKYHTMHLLAFDEIQEYEKNKKHYYTLAYEICSRLGIYLDNLDPVIDNYLNDWLFKGYSDETLKTLAKFCFKSENNSLEKMDIVIQKLYKQGIVSMEGLTEYMRDLQIIDDRIKQVFAKLSISRIVTNRDRELFSIWFRDWNITEELFDYAVSLSIGKVQSWSYLAKVLSNFHEKNIKTKQEAEKESQNYTFEINNTNKQKLNMNTRSYSDEELNLLFDNLKEIDV